MPISPLVEWRVVGMTLYVEPEFYSQDVFVFKIGVTSRHLLNFSDSISSSLIRGEK